MSQRGIDAQGFAMSEKEILVEDELLVYYSGADTVIEIRKFLLKK